MKTTQHFSDLYRMARYDGVMNALAYDTIMTLERHPDLRHLIGNALNNFDIMFRPQFHADRTAEANNESDTTNTNYLPLPPKRTFALIKTEEDGTLSVKQRTKIVDLEGKVHLTDSSNFKPGDFSNYMRNIRKDSV